MDTSIGFFGLSATSNVSLRSLDVVCDHQNVRGFSTKVSIGVFDFSQSWLLLYNL